MIKQYAHVKDGKVVNVSLWDGTTDWTPEEEIVVIPATSSAGIGWDYDGKKFIDNRPPSEISVIEAAGE